MADWMDEDDEEVQQFQEPEQQQQQPQLFGEDDDDDDDDDDDAEQPGNEIHQGHQQMIDGGADDDEGDIFDDMEGDDLVSQQKDSLLMRFCPNDSSMLYPQENKATKTLQYACRLCRYNEACPNQPLIYRNVLKKEVGNVLNNVPSAISDDPTLARSQNANCANCHHNEAVFFQSDATQSDSLALIFVCCNCDHKWVN